MNAGPEPELKETSSEGRLIVAIGRSWFCLAGMAATLAASVIHAEASEAPAPSPGVAYTNIVMAEVPWSIHVVKVDRGSGFCEIQSTHAGRGVLGMSTLVSQIASINPALGTPVAAINGGFYRRDTAFAGLPRGLQMVESEVLSAPSGDATFWTDLLGEAHLAEVTSRFQVSWPGGQTTPFGLNGERAANGVELYTAAAGPATPTQGGRELILERVPGGRWLPLRINRTFSARVREIRDAGKTPLGPNTLVLSLGPEILGRFASVTVGTLLEISTASTPALTGARTALSGGPVLLRNGKRQKVEVEPDAPYELSSMLERHPRSAIAWNRQSFFLVQVDGRQRDLSVGMTLDELAGFLAKLGCEEALNLDGGGSSSLWFEGEIRNSPCDGYDRNIANSLIVLRKPVKGAKPPADSPERSKQDGG